MKRRPLITGVVLAIGDLRQAFESITEHVSPVRCLLCGHIVQDGSPAIGHANAHVRRGELERVTVDGVTYDADGNPRPTWVGSHIGYRTPGAGGWYVVEILDKETRATPLPYHRGELPKWGSFTATEKEARESVWVGKTTKYEAREIAPATAEALAS